MPVAPTHNLQRRSAPRTDPLCEAAIEATEEAILAAMGKPENMSQPQ